MKNGLQRAAKAWVAAVVTAVAPILVDATNTFVASTIGVIVAAVAVYATPNKEV